MRAPSEPVKNPSADMEEFARNVARMMEEGGKALAAYLKPREEGRADDQYAEVTDVVKTLGQVADYWLRDPQRALELQSSLGKAYLDLWANAVKRMAGEKVEPVAAPDPKDKRFADPEWSSNQFFDFLKQAYLLTVQWANRLVRDAEGLDPHTLQKADFYVRQIANAIAPSNFVLTNPELLRETLASKAENLVRGMHMLAEDIQAGHGSLQIRQSDSKMFEVGRNLALTPGKVVFENELMQLIQYSPSTATVLKRPLLIVPPWINKFYILDLTPEKSFIKWCVDQGLTVFVISWVNPDNKLAKKSFEDYMRDGPLAALDVIEKATGEHEVNAIGYCVGGTLLADHARLYGQQARQPHHVGDVLRRAGGFHLRRRSQGLRRRGADLRARARNERTRLPRRQEDGDRLQPAALERSDLALCHQQLSQGQGAGSVRPALLERGCDADAGREPLVLSAQLLSARTG